MGRRGGKESNFTATGTGKLLSAPSIPLQDAWHGLTIFVQIKNNNNS